MPDAWRLAVGTLTALRVPAPRTVTPVVAGRAMLLAPVAVLPLGLLVAGLGLLGAWLSLPPLVVSVLAVGALAAGSRALHWDGLSDVADGLSASYDRARSLQVMKSGTSGPAGVVATVVVLGTQAAALASLLTTTRGAVVAGLLVCVSRAALALCCLRGVPGARPDGLGAAYVGTVRPTAALALWLVAAGLLVLAAGWSGLVAAALALLVVAVLLHRVVRRFGGVTGDVLGAAVELALAALLVGVLAGPPLGAPW
ncbi:Cobalamin synthase [Nocardioides dokdonensis FR1436]|uniref:Adenosylcobinamide-GDP ribazoletransferase n=1 Tax=Nocardioides dokdonensis FR1436 TaxID=1300347 RepID=A0A1A9GPN6_9ACTN|nr:adenosylcobinamide-GDP ribazoletransferase [Nocardioides dokdonensis]ANH40248.1 Cobalamin synthase [Nocardioides dokdonensis FR1436]